MGQVYGAVDFGWQGSWVNRIALIWLPLQDRPGGEVYATGKGLFVIPKDSNPLKLQNKLEESQALEGHIKVQTGTAKQATNGVSK